MDFTLLLKQHLPRGKAWQRGVLSVAHALYEGLSAEMQRVQDRADQLLLEMDPRTTTELIADWERVCGLPDPCTTAPVTLADRRAAVVARIISRGGWSGGPSVAFLTSLIVALGYAEGDIVIRRFQYQEFTCTSECDDMLWSVAAGWPFVWEFDVKHGDLDAQLMCQVEKYALAHLGLLFAFPLFFFEDGTFTRSGTSAVLINPQTGEQTTLGIDEMGQLRIGV